LLTATPDQLLALQNSRQAFMAQMKQLGIDEAKLAYDDVANARAREIAVRDKLPAILAISVTVGFFAVLLIMLFRGVP